MLEEWNRRLAVEVTVAGENRHRRAAEAMAR